MLESCYIPPQPSPLRIKHSQVFQPFLQDQLHRQLSSSFVLLDAFQFLSVPVEMGGSERTQRSLTGGISNTKPRTVEGKRKAVSSSSRRDTFEYLQELEGTEPHSF